MHVSRIDMGFDFDLQNSRSLFACLLVPKILRVVLEYASISCKKVN